MISMLVQLCWRFAVAFKPLVNLHKHFRDQTDWLRGRAQYLPPLDTDVISSGKNGSTIISTELFIQQALFVLRHGF